MLDDEGFLMAFLLTTLVLSITTPYLGSRVGVFLVPWDLFISMESTLDDNSRKTSLSSIYYILLGDLTPRHSLVPWGMCHGTLEPIDIKGGMPHVG